jgi:hypothetical protein
MVHEVTLNIDTKFVLHKDVTCEIKSGGTKLGTLLISKGNIEWLPRGAYVNKKRLTWTAFAQLMQGEGSPTKVRKRAPKKVAPKKAAAKKAALVNAKLN